MKELTQKLRNAIADVGLSHITDQIIAASSPSILLELQSYDESHMEIACSKIGGTPDLPKGFIWPEWKGNPMGFLGQINLGDTSQYDIQGLLPTNGLLAFFYDLYEQPWGFDPKELGSSKICFFPERTNLIRTEVPNDENFIPCSKIIYSPQLTLPVFRSDAYYTLIEKTNLSRSDQEKYWKLCDQLQAIYGKTKNPARNRLLGHPHNVQGDMLLEATLVTNGIYCGDEKGYADPRVPGLLPLTRQWQLLFQLDSDDESSLCWGDAGLLYFWILRPDLAQQKFDHHWLSLQCF